jgi:hypothetical protein
MTRILTIIALLFATPAWAVLKTSDLIEFHKTSPETAEIYLMGLIDGMISDIALNDLYGTKGQICMPEDFVLTENLAIGLLDAAHARVPQGGRYAGATLFAELKRLFPCEK